MSCTSRTSPSLHTLSDNKLAQIIEKKDKIYFDLLRDYIALGDDRAREVQSDTEHLAAEGDAHAIKLLAALYDLCRYTDEQRNRAYYGSKYWRDLKKKESQQ